MWKGCVWIVGVLCAWSCAAGLPDAVFPTANPSSPLLCRNCGAHITRVAEYRHPTSETLSSEELLAVVRRLRGTSCSSDLAMAPAAETRSPAR